MQKIKVEPQTPKREAAPRVQIKKERVDTEEDIGRCVSLPVTNRSVLNFLRVVRALPEFRFIVDADYKLQVAKNERKTLQLRESLANWTPTDFYKVCFELEPDARVVDKVRAMLDKERNDILNGLAQVDQRDRNGYIYTFHWLGDPQRIVKIGRTIRTPEERRAEWERALSPEEGVNVIMLFSYATSANVLAESIIHTVLTCQHAVGRINPLSNDKLEEFFEISNIMALKVFIRNTIRYVDRFSLYYRKQRRDSAKLFLTPSMLPSRQSRINDNSR